jgi:hypothetical protein
MTEEKAQEVAIALSQNLITFHKGRRASARTPTMNCVKAFLTEDVQVLTFVSNTHKVYQLHCTMAVLDKKVMCRLAPVL